MKKIEDITYQELKNFQNEISWGVEEAWEVENPLDDFEISLDTWIKRTAEALHEQNSKDGDPEYDEDVYRVAVHNIVADALSDVEPEF